LAIGYFAQHQLEQLRPDWSPLRHLQTPDERASDQALRNFLGGFGFAGDRALQPVAPFSGGEKARLALALLVWQRPNLLLLDEPTNHLDLDMRHALTLALQDYQGAMIVVSHDRHLLRTTTDEFLLVAKAGRNRLMVIWMITVTGSMSSNAPLIGMLRHAMSITAVALLTAASRNGRTPNGGNNSRRNVNHCNSKSKSWNSGWRSCIASKPAYRLN
jgi:energy-coupling factor transporter ATP-binding protein EcfA2